MKDKLFCLAVFIAGIFVGGWQFTDRAGLAAQDKKREALREELASLINQHAGIIDNHTAVINAQAEYIKTCNQPKETKKKGKK